MKKGNAGIVVLVIALFAVVIAMCGVALYYETKDKGTKIEQGNNDKVQVNADDKKEQDNNQTIIEPLTDKDKEYLKKFVLKGLEEYEISGGITKQNLSILENKLKAEEKDTTMNKFIEEFIVIVDAAFVTNNGRDFDKAWNSISTETREDIETLVWKLQANELVNEYDQKQYEQQLSLAYVEWISENPGKKFTSDNIPDLEFSAPAGYTVEVQNSTPILVKVDQGNNSNPQINTGDVNKEENTEKPKVAVTKVEMYEYLKIFMAVNKDFKIGKADDMRNFVAIYIIKNYDAVEKNSGSYYVEISKEEVSRIMKKYFGIEKYNLTNYTGDLFYDIQVKENTVLISWDAIGLGWESLSQDMDIKYVGDNIIVTSKIISNVTGETNGTMKFTLKIDEQSYYVEKIEHIK